MLLKENKSIWEVGSYFEIDRGSIQNILNQCASFGMELIRFCETLNSGLYSYQFLLKELIKSLQSNFSKEELLPFFELGRLLN